MTHTKNQGASRALEQVLNAACDNKIVPGIAVLAQSVDGEPRLLILPPPNTRLSDPSQALSITPIRLGNDPSVIQIYLWR